MSGTDGRPAGRPLEGVRVLAIENYIAAPLASMLLADWGADVVKVEPPSGDTYRTFPPIERSSAGVSSASFVRLNRGKRSIILNLQEPEGRDKFIELARVADVLIENLRPGALSSLGIGYEELSLLIPRLIVVSISGFGQADVLPGPYQDMPAFDLLGQAMSGMTYATGRDGDPPAPVGFPLIDTTAADWATTATLLALRQRDQTGRGQHVDVAMYDVAIHLLEYQIGGYGWTGQLPLRANGRLASSAPFEIMRASDGYFAIAVSGQPNFERFCDAIGRADLLADPRMGDGTSRAQEMDGYLRPIIEEWISKRTVDEVLARFRECRVPASRVQSVGDLFECPHVAARNMIVRVPDPVLGEVSVAGNPIKGSDIAEPLLRPAPQLGANTDEVFASWLGNDWSDKL